MTSGAPGSSEYLVDRRDGLIDLAATAARMPASDLDAALLIVAERPGELHYVSEASRWHIWDGKCHRPDTSDQAGQLVQEFAWRYGVAISSVRGVVRDEVASELDPSAGDAAADLAIRKRMEPFGAAAKYAAGLRKNAGRMSLLRELATVCATDEATMEDRWPHHLNCANYIVDLRTGQTMPHDPRWMMTYCLDVEYHPEALNTGASWQALTWHVAKENPACYQFLLKLLGYSLLGANPEQLIVFLLGPTASGKSKLLDVVAGVLGALGHNSPASLITQGKNERNARVENSLAGKRFISITETAEQLFIDEGQVKRLTGETRISHHRHYNAVMIDTLVTWLIFLATNEMPTLLHCDEAMRRRSLVFPCGDEIPVEHWDRDLARRILATEAEAVLASLVAGAMAYYQEGLVPPMEVVVETAKYVAEQDTLAPWLSGCFMMTDPYGKAGLNGSGWPRQGYIRKHYVNWCREQRIKPLGVTAFHKRLRESTPGVVWNQDRGWYQGILPIQEPRMVDDES